MVHGANFEDVEVHMTHNGFAYVVEEPAADKLRYAKVYLSVVYHKLTDRRKW